MKRYVTLVYIPHLPCETALFLLSLTFVLNFVVLVHFQNPLNSYHELLQQYAKTTWTWNAKEHFDSIAAMMDPRQNCEAWKDNFNNWHLNLILNTNLKEAVLGAAGTELFSSVSPPFCEEFESASVLFGVGKGCTVATWRCWLEFMISAIAG